MGDPDHVGGDPGGPDRAGGDLGDSDRPDAAEDLSDLDPAFIEMLDGMAPGVRWAWIEMEREAQAGLAPGQAPLSVELHAAIEQEAFSGARLAQLRLAREIRALADARYDAAVVAAREVGYSWAELGRVLGVSRQALQQRFASQ